MLILLIKIILNIRNTNITYKIRKNIYKLQNV